MSELSSIKYCPYQVSRNILLTSNANISKFNVCHWKDIVHVDKSWERNAAAASATIVQSAVPPYPLFFPVFVLNTTHHNGIAQCCHPPLALATAQWKHNDNTVIYLAWHRLHYSCGGGGGRASVPGGYMAGRRFWWVCCIQNLSYVKLSQKAMGIQIWLEVRDYYY